MRGGSGFECRHVSPLGVLRAIAIDADAVFPVREVGVASGEPVEVACADGDVEGVFPVVFAVADTVFGVRVVAQADEAARTARVEGAVGGDAEAAVFCGVDGGDEEVLPLDGDDLGVEVYGAEFEPPVFAGDGEDFVVSFWGEEFGESGHGGFEFLPVGAVVFGAFLEVVEEGCEGRAFVVFEAGLKVVDGDGVGDVGEAVAFEGFWFELCYTGL